MKGMRFVTFAIALMFLTATFVEAGHKRRHRDSSTSFQVRLGGFFPEGESNFWVDNESIFTLNASDFDDGAIGATFSRAYGNHLEMDFNIDHYNGTTVSEYRNFVDGAGFPILHDSTLETTPVTVGLRLVPFGRYGGRDARPVFFVGAGAGVNFWRYREVGDFIDFSDPAQPVFFDDLRERGAAFVTYGTAGIEMPVGANFNLGLEARYFSSDDDLNDDFAGLGTIDMSGFGAYVSANWRF